MEIVRGSTKSHSMENLLQFRLLTYLMANYVTPMNILLSAIYKGKSGRRVVFVLINSSWRKISSLAYSSENCR